MHATKNLRIYISYKMTYDGMHVLQNAEINNDKQIREFTWKDNHIFVSYFLRFSEIFCLSVICTGSCRAILEEMMMSNVFLLHL